MKLLKIKKLCNVAICFSVVMALACCKRQTVDEMVFVVKTQFPQSKSIVISNTSKQTVNFTFKHRDGFYFNYKELIREINFQIDEYYQEPDYRKAWRYVGKIKQPSFPVLCKSLKINPLFQINSIGSGYNGGLAYTLSVIWKIMGYKSRCWNLGGYIVPELYVESRWQMFDPVYNCFYFTKSYEIAGVQDLMNDGSLITSPVRKKKGPKTKVVGIHPQYGTLIIKADQSADDSLLTNLEAHFQLLSELYTTKNNNMVIDNQFDKDCDYFFTLPPKSTVIYPIIDTISSTSRNLFLLKLKIDSSWSGIINIPLCLYSVYGEGSVKMGSLLYDLKRKELTEKLNNGVNCGDAVEVSTHLGMELNYLINIKLFKLDSVNYIYCKGSNVNGLKVSLLNSNGNVPANKNTIDNSIMGLIKTEHDLSTSNEKILRK